MFGRRLPLPEGVDASSVSAGYKDGILNVQLSSSAGATLNRKRRLSVRVTVNSDVTPGSHHATGHRTVRLTTTPTIPGVPSG